MSIKRVVGLAAAVGSLAVLPFTAGAPAAAAAPVPAKAASVPVPAQGSGTAADGPYGGAQFHTDGVRIRSCASTSCAVLGLGYRSHHVGYYCNSYTNGWVHIKDFTTGVDGWASAQYLYYYCD
ncbi:SH3 domain-containing protein [Streptomyces sp. TRM 70351]|uniref:SH3 domain-containing protein n=1 Tax=Streptomyces sp. TRM 70351 TaxID=3116552 RepID=UPI002E7BEF01|nr:SH3 domain-containing protein [Streptomyces sp. TRM 70351]MEE1929506.1 SH3 domain-containing protein [Streptomyces sp. TRM 70351]